MHLRSGKKIVFTPSPPRKRTHGRQRSSPLVGEKAAKTIMAAATRCAPPEEITRPYTPTTTKPDLRVNDWSDLEVVCDLGPAVGTWNSGVIPESGTEIAPHVCGIESGEGKRRAVPWVSALIFWGLVVMAFFILYPEEGDGVGARVGGVYKGTYEGVYLWEWAFILSRFVYSRDGILVDV
ncbi:hypothetical protein HOY80DRAFT_66885 [Tuber brumale]|nr:hypothetical protein HOY80DRAFT_66885 [Tuber brumale]